MNTAFIKEALQKRPPFTQPFLHRNFNTAFKKAQTFTQIETGGSILAVVGPTHVGKSMLKAMLLDFIFENVFDRAPPEFTPVIGCSASTGREGRTSLKFVYEMLLTDAGSPLFDPTKLALATGYRPTGVSTEAKMLAALVRALCCIQCRFVFIDEAQYIVRAKDPFFRSTILESLKSLISETRTLVLFGGYEFLDALISNQAHLAARSTILHMDRYRQTEADWNAWLQIIREFQNSSVLEWESEDLLFTHAEDLLIECHGVIGILEKRLQRAQMAARAKESPITSSILKSTRLVEAAYNTIAVDISHGESLLRTTGSGIQAQSTRPPRKGRAMLKPFETKPARAVRRYE